MPLFFKYAKFERPEWAKSIPMAGVEANLGAAALILVWGCLRALRLGVLIDDRGVVVRNFFRTYRLTWSQVTGFADGSARNYGDDGSALGYWALNVVIAGETGGASAACRRPWRALTPALP